MTTIDPDTLLRGYAIGVFPMAEARDDADCFWVEPRRRAVLPLEGFHLARSLAKRIAQDRFRVTADSDFPGVLAGCADRDETWINVPIARAVTALHAGGRAHSVEVWDGAALVGGLYGVRLGRAFFGESMFSRRPDASKVALAWLVARLRLGGFELLDCQFMTPHLARLGAVEIGRAAYRARLAAALSGPEGDWTALDEMLRDAASGALADGGPASPSASPGKRIVQLLTQTS